jgi:hypothetical protein
MAEALPTEIILKIPTTLIAIGLAFLTSAQAQAQVNPPGADPTHYQCYEVTSYEGPAGINVKLRDQFGQTQVTLAKPHFLCTPVQKNNMRPRDTRTHFVCYYGYEGQPVNKKVRVQNQFGKDVLGVGKPVFVCVPSIKALLR